MRRKKETDHDTQDNAEMPAAEGVVAGDQARTAPAAEPASADNGGPAVPPVCEEPAAAPAPQPGVDDRLLRLQADFENFRRRTLRERNELYLRANEDLIRELLPVIDHMALALKAAVEHGADKVFTDGFRLVAEQLDAMIGKFGVAPIVVGNGAFDPNLHEAVSHLPSATVPENHVCIEVRRGYRLGERLLRAAQVVVSSGPGPGGSAPAMPAGAEAAG